jgi:hypothetical protein
MGLFTQGLLDLAHNCKRFLFPISIPCECVPGSPEVVAMVSPSVCAVERIFVALTGIPSHQECRITPENTAATKPMRAMRALRRAWHVALSGAMLAAME